MTLEHAVVVPLADFECRNHMMWREIAWGHGKDGVTIPEQRNFGAWLVFEPNPFLELRRRSSRLTLAPTRSLQHRRIWARGRFDDLNTAPVANCHACTAE